MQKAPEGFDAEALVEIVPAMELELEGSTWPPATEETETGTASVGSWEVSRNLIGSALPGQIRGASGFSIATGSVTFPQPAGNPLSPWGRGSLNLGPGGKCTLRAVNREAGTVIVLGKFEVAPISGKNTQNWVNLDLEEDSKRLRSPISVPWRYVDAEPFVDAAWVLSEIASQGGFETSPPEQHQALVSVPLCGALRPRAGVLSAGTGKFTSVGGAAGLGPESTATYTEARAGFDGAVLNERCVSALVAGNGGMVSFGGITIDIRHTHVLAWGQGVTATHALPATQDKARYVTVRAARSANGRVITFFVHTPQGGWQAMQSLTMPAATPAWTGETPTTISTLTTTMGGAGDERWISAVQTWCWANDQTAPTYAPTAQIEVADSPLGGVLGMDVSNAWKMAQDIAVATMGAVWISETGVFTYRNREALRGAHGTIDQVEALDKFESLDWTVDPEDVADRVELSYIPTQVVKTSSETTLWEATEPIRVGPGQTVEIYAEFPGATDRLAPFLPIWDEGAPADRYSRWAAAYSADGTGERPADRVLSFNLTLVTQSKVRISITNNGAANLWMVDATGNPCVILRTSLQVLPGEPVTISSGADETEALNPLSIDAGAWVQDAGTANLMLSWAASQTARAQAVITQVRVKPDLTRQLGDVIKLTDGHTGLVAKAIITGTNSSGDHSGYTQHLDLALLGVTFSDFDNWCQNQGILTFKQLDDWCVARGITTFDQLDEFLIDLGGNI